jgi:hypothetical protein
MTWVEFILVCVVMVLIVLPPKYDPAIRLKEWIEGRKR